MKLQSNGQTITTGAIVRYRGKPYTIHHCDSKSGYIQILSCDDRRHFATVFPRDIGAQWRGNDHVNAIFQGVLSCSPF